MPNTPTLPDLPLALALDIWWLRYRLHRISDAIADCADGVVGHPTVPEPSLLCDVGYDDYEVQDVAEVTT